MATTGNRIPASLQAIFMASNKGEEVYVPPTDNSANRVYRRNRSEAGKPVFVKFAGSSLKRTMTNVSSLFVLLVHYGTDLYCWTRVWYRKPARVRSVEDDKHPLTRPRLPL